MKQVPGFLGASCVVDREKSTGAASTLWESLEAMNKVEQIGQQARIDSEQATGVEVIDVDRFEITSLDMVGTPDPQPEAPARFQGTCQRYQPDDWARLHSQQLGDARAA